MNRTPKFICIGAQKSGTANLLRVLEKHPDVYLPQKREVHFFDDDVAYGKGKEFYFGNFSENHLCNGEKTPAYLYLEKCINRINTTLGNKVKFIVILRNPVDRALSHYNMNVSRNIETLSWDEAVREEGERILLNEEQNVLYSYIERGKYCKQLKRYFEIYDKQNFKIILFEDYISNENKYVSETLKFLDLPQMNLDTNVYTHKTIIYKYSILRKISQDFRGKDILKKIIPQRMKEYLKKIIFNKKMIDKNHKLSKLQKKEVYEKFFKKDIDELEQLLQIDLTQWRY